MKGLQIFHDDCSHWNGFKPCLPQKLGVTTNSADITYNVKNLELDLENSSSAMLKGTTDSLTVTMENSADLYARGLVAQNANITLSNSSTAHVNAVSKLTYNASNSSRIYYAGIPTLENLGEYSPYELQVVSEIPELK